VIKPRPLLFTLFGEFVFPLGQREVPVSKLVALAASFGISSTALRTALSRMTREGWLTHLPESGRTSYGLTKHGRDLMKEGIARIYETRPTWDGQWLIVAYSVPEVNRDRRDRLRRGLSFLGLGSLGNGIFVTPHDLASQVRELLGRQHLEGELTCIRGHLLLPTERIALVRRAWDLDDLARRYTDFIKRVQADFEVDKRGLDTGTLTNHDAFVRRTLLIHEFRRFPFTDPDLPPELLPTRWIGTVARELFLAYRELLKERSAAHYLAL